MAHAPYEDEQEGTVLPGNFSNTPVPRPKWRVEPQANLSHREAANYRRLHHGYRMLDMAAVGLRNIGNRFAELSAGDEYLAAIYTDWEKRYANACIHTVECYMYGCTH